MNALDKIYNHTQDSLSIEGITARELLCANLDTLNMNAERIAEMIEFRLMMHDNQYDEQTSDISIAGAIQSLIVSLVSINAVLGYECNKGMLDIMSMNAFDHSELPIKTAKTVNHSGAVRYYESIKNAMFLEDN